MSALTSFVIEHWDDVLAVGGLVGGWLWHKARGEKTKTVREILDDVVRQVINAEGVNLDNVKAKAERAIREALAKRNVKGKLGEHLVHEFVEYAAGELAERYAETEKAWRKLEAAIASGEKAVADIGKLEKAQAKLETAVTGP